MKVTTNYGYTLIPDHEPAPERVAAERAAIRQAKKDGCTGRLDAIAKVNCWTRDSVCYDVTICSPVKGQRTRSIEGRYSVWVGIVKPQTA